MLYFGSQMVKNRTGRTARWALPRILVVLVLVGAKSLRLCRFKLDVDKFGSNVLRINTDRLSQLTGSDFRFDVIILKSRPWCPFMQQSALLPRSEWKRNVCRGIYCDPVSAWSVVRSYLFLEDDAGKKSTKKDKKKRKAEKEKEKEKDKTEKEPTTKKPSKMVKQFTLFKNYTWHHFTKQFALKL